MKTWNPIRQHISGSIGSRDWDLWEFSEGLCYLLGMEKILEYVGSPVFGPPTPCQSLGAGRLKVTLLEEHIEKKIRQTAGPTNPKVNARRRCFWDSEGLKTNWWVSIGGENGTTFRSSQNEVPPISQIEVLPKLIFPRPTTWIIVDHG